MRKFKKVLASTLAGILAVGALASCSDNGNTNSTTPSTSTPTSESKVDTSGVKSIYFLNFKPEIASKYEAIAAKYKEEKGIEVRVQTAASGEYEKTLTSEMAKSDPPTIFQINGPVGYENWKDYCADLKDSELYQLVSDKSLAVKSGDGVYGDDRAVGDFHDSGISVPHGIRHGDSPGASVRLRGNTDTGKIRVINLVKRFRTGHFALAAGCAVLHR